MASTVSLTIGATTENLYALVSDVTRMGEWSPECYRCEWTGGSSGPAAGATFTGYNRLGPFKWKTACVVETAEPGREFSILAGDEKEGKTRWTYRFEPAGSETRVSESYETLIEPPVPIRIVERVWGLGRSRDTMLRKGMRLTLERIKRTAESS